jgi:hypothetical protein
MKIKRQEHTETSSYSSVVVGGGGGKGGDTKKNKKFAIESYSTGSQRLNKTYEKHIMCQAGGGGVLWRKKSVLGT